MSEIQTPPREQDPMINIMERKEDRLWIGLFLHPFNKRIVDKAHFHPKTVMDREEIDNAAHSNEDGQNDGEDLSDKQALQIL